MTNIMPACHSAANATDIAAFLLTLMFFVNMYNLALILKKVYKPADMQFKATLLKTISLSVAFLVIAFFYYSAADEAFAEEIWTAVATSAMNMEFLMLLGYLMPDFDDDETVDPLIVLLAFVTADPAPVITTTTDLAVRPSGAIGQHTPPVVMHWILSFWCLLLVAWGTTAIACDPPVAVIVGPFGCISSLTFAIGATMTGFLTNQKRGDLAFMSMHTHHFPRLPGSSPFQQLKTAYDGVEPILALSCNQPDTPGCFNVYYSNRMHKDNERTIHKFQAHTKGQRPSKRQVNTVTEGIDSNDPDPGDDIFGTYDFVGKDVDAEHDLGNDPDFPHDLSQQVSDAGDTFNQKGAWCLNLLRLDGGFPPALKEATAGFLVANDNYHASIDEDGWMDKCEDSGWPTAA